MGLIFTLIGIVTAVRFWDAHLVISLLVLAVTLYQTVSLYTMYGKRNSPKKEFKISIFMNMISSITIAISFILSFFYC